MAQYVKNMFDDAIAIEMIAAKIYNDFQTMFGYMDDIAEFWEGMKDDEIKHAEILRDTRDSLAHDVLESQADPLVWENLLSVKMKLMHYKKEDIHNLNDAYELAHQLESSEVNSIFKFLYLEYFSTSLRQAFILSEIQNHQNKLMLFSEQFGTQKWQKQILIRNS